MKCNRKKALKDEISSDWNDLNLAAQILVCIGGFMFVATIFLAFYKIHDQNFYKTVETIFRSSLTSIFGFVLSSNIKSTNQSLDKKYSNNETVVTYDEETFKIPENYK